MRKLIIILAAVTLFGCKSNGQAESQTPKEYAAVLTEREQAFSQRSKSDLGEPAASILFNVKTDNTKDFKDGLIPWISLEKPDNDQLLVDKDLLVIEAQELTVIIDYPVTKEYKFTLRSNKGFTKLQLLKAIRENYLKLYEEEETTATIKTIPREKRKGMINRNQTNGKYGIWGHDIGDLDLPSINVYKKPYGEIILLLEIES